MSDLGSPRVHLRLTDSTNRHARELAAAGAPHGTLVTATEQTAGRGRQGRTWTAPTGSAVLASLIVRDPPRLLPLAAGAAVAEAVEAVEVAEVAKHRALIKWPNDVLVGGRKVAGILVEGRPQEGWAVVGVGLNVAIREDEFPLELRDRAGSLGLEPSDVEPVLERLLDRLGRWIQAPDPDVLKAIRRRDALLDAPVRWSGGHGRGAGINASGQLVVATDDGPVTLDAGEVHLGALTGPPDPA